jgi:poly(3-hydroxybutyrate) depolymerase
MYDFGRREDGLLYMVFEHVSGQSLDRQLDARGSFDVDATLRIIEQMLLGLRAAHAVGVLHRDIKPGNVLLYEFDGDPHRVKVLDFGIAKETGPEAVRLTRTGKVVGTLRYMAPEQLFDGEASAGSDLYSVGLVAYELLTGEPAITGESQREMIEGRVAAPRKRLPESVAAEPVRRWIERMMDPTPQMRPSSTTEALEELAATRAMLAGWTPQPSGQLPSAPRQIRSNAALPAPGSRPAGRPSTARAAAIGVGVGLVAAMLAVAMFTLGRDGNEPPANVRIQPGLLASTPRSVPDAEAVAAAPVDEPVAEKTPDAGQAAAHGCGSPAPFRGFGAYGLPEDGLDDFSWATYIPERYDGVERVPLVVVLHRKFRDGARTMREMGIVEAAEEHGFVVFAPTSRNRTTWQHDMDRLPLMIEHGRDTLCIDSQRLYVIGEEIGATAAKTLACMMPVSSMAMGWDETTRKCTPSTATSTLLWYGIHDRRLPADGGRACDITTGRVQPRARVARAWRKVYGCSETTRPWGEQTGGECAQFLCKGGVLVECAANAGNRWPASPPIIPIADCEVELREPVFDFMTTFWTFFEQTGVDVEPPDLEEVANAEVQLSH